MTNSLDLPTAFHGAWPPENWCDVNVVVAISGGKDSVSLLHLLVEAKTHGVGLISAAHLNHGLRGEESDEDERFVQRLCDDLGVPLDIGHADVSEMASEQGDGVESAAREARYDFLLRTAQQRGARFVATAHTADDQVETVLHRILRGTGIGGLSGMRFARPLDDSVTLVRPLLEIPRSAIDQFAQSRQLIWREDASNKHVHYTRNRIRGELLPSLRANFNPSVNESLLRLAELAAECQDEIDRQTKEMASRCAMLVGDSVVVDCGEFAEHSRYLVSETLIHIWANAGLSQQSMGKREWNALADMALTAGDAAARDFPNHVRAQKKGEQLTLTRLIG